MIELKSFISDKKFYINVSQRHNLLNILSIYFKITRQGLKVTNYQITRKLLNFQKL